jgi:hypothetical protein
MSSIQKYIIDNYNFKENEVIIKFIDKNINEINKNIEYIYTIFILDLCFINVKINKNIISFKYVDRQCDVIEYINKYWIITMYPI